MSVIKELVFTPTCLACGLLGAHLCGTCELELNPFIGKPLKNVSAIFCASKYEGWIREKLIEFKNGRAQNVPALAAALTVAFDFANFTNSFTLIPIPSASEKIMERGFDSISILGKEVSKRVESAPKLTAALFLKSQVRDQVGLTATERKVNMAQAFGIRQKLDGDIVLIDDVITTGATMSSAARILRIAGAQRVFGIALCGSPKSR